MFSLLGSSKCGSKLKCIIENTDLSNNCIKLNCTYIKEKGNYSKRYLRNPIRAIIEKELENKSVHMYCTEKAYMLMAEEDSKLPHLLVLLFYMQQNRKQHWQIMLLLKH